MKLLVTLWVVMFLVSDPITAMPVLLENAMEPPIHFTTPLIRGSPGAPIPMMNTTSLVSLSYKIQLVLSITCREILPVRIHLIQPTSINKSASHNGFQQVALVWTDGDGTFHYHWEGFGTNTIGSPYIEESLSATC